MACSLYTVGWLPTFYWFNPIVFCVWTSPFWKIHVFAVPDFPLFGDIKMVWHAIWIVRGETCFHPRLPGGKAPKFSHEKSQQNDTLLQLNTAKTCWNHQVTTNLSNDVKWFCLWCTPNAYELFMSLMYCLVQIWPTVLWPSFQVVNLHLECVVLSGNSCYLSGTFLHRAGLKFFNWVYLKICQNIFHFMTFWLEKKNILALELKVPKSNGWVDLPFRIAQDA